MSDNAHDAGVAIDIDALLQDTWLQVISLRHGPQIHEGDGQVLWDCCVADVERVQQALKAEGLSEASCRYILTAQCALLDEAVKSRGVQDDACVQWYDIPLQGRFLGTMDAGDTLCDRMWEVLNSPSPDRNVLTCFQRIMMLGFLGSFRSQHDPERQQLVDALNQHVTPFTCSQTHSILAESRPGQGMRGRFSSWPVRIVLSVAILTALWWGLDTWLDVQIMTLLPESVK